MLKDRSDKALIGFVVLLTAWLFVGLPFLYLPTSEQHKAPQPAIATQSPSGEPKGTVQAPFFIKVLPGDDAAEKAAQEAEDREEKKDADRWLVRWTMALFFATFGLIVATGVLGFFAWRQMHDMKESLASAKISADAAMLSAKAAIGIELPIIRIKPDDVGTSELRQNGELTAFFSVNSVDIYNLGRTSMLPIEIKSGMTRGNSLPVEPTYSCVDAFPLYAIYEPDDKIFKRLSDCSVQIEDGDWERVRADQISLWFYCVITYEDFMRTRHDAAFCWKLSPGPLPKEWRPDPTPAYNRKT